MYLHLNPYVRNLVVKTFLSLPDSEIPRYLGFIYSKRLERECIILDVIARLTGLTDLLRNPHGQVDSEMGMHSSLVNACLSTSTFCSNVS